MTRSTHTAALVAAAILTFCHCLPGHAVVPDRLSYQGFLTDPIGTPVDADVNITCRLYTVESGGTALWIASQLVAVSNGLFSVELGDSLNPFPDGIFDDPLWLGIQVEGDPEMMPRRALTSVAFSFSAEGAEFLGGHSATSLVNGICELYALTNNSGVRPQLCGNCFTAADCDNGNECTIDSCSNPGSANAACSSIDVPDGTPCDTGECLAGQCTDIDPCSGIVCDTAEQCLVIPGACVTPGMCVYDNAADGTACDDGDPTTVDDQCSNGTCVGTIP